MSNNEIILGVVFVTLILLLLVAGVAISFYIANRQRLEKDMRLKQAALDYEQELRLAESAVSESVMTHVSRELHDNVGHILTQLRFQIESKMLDGTEYEQMLLPMQQTLTTASSQLRLISRTLSTEFLQNNDLIASIKMEVERIRLLNILAIHLKHNDEIHSGLSKEQHLIIFRIFQEAMSNIIKHAEAKTLAIEINDEDGFSMKITDDGKGFDRSAVIENGIRNMQRRAELAQLGFTLLTAPGKGCTIILSHEPTD